jgi:hypothetical protein
VAKNSEISPFHGKHVRTERMRQRITDLSPEELPQAEVVYVQAKQAKKHCEDQYNIRHERGDDGLDAALSI